MKLLLSFLGMNAEHHKLSMPHLELTELTRYVQTEFACWNTPMTPGWDHRHPRVGAAMSWRGAPRKGLAITVAKPQPKGQAPKSLEPWKEL